MLELQDQIKIWRALPSKKSLVEAVDLFGKVPTKIGILRNNLWKRLLRSFSHAWFT